MRKSALYGLAGAAVVCAFSGAFAAEPRPDPQIACYFLPQDARCRPLIEGNDTSPATQSIKAAYEGYGRYVRDGSGSLTEEDRHYLAENEIALPDLLTPVDLGGLHNVIHDPKFDADPDGRRRAVNWFLRHAVETELYCETSACGAASKTQA